MWRKRLDSGFEACFGASTQGAGIRYQNTSQIKILRHFEKKGARCKILRVPRSEYSFVMKRAQGILGQYI